jgi:hypothetical protein
MFRRLLAQTAGWTQPYQCWLQIDPADSSQDAVYLHAPNPNGSEFPIEFEWVQWNAEIPERLREFVTDPDWEFGRSDGQWTHFYVRRRTAL